MRRPLVSLSLALAAGILTGDGVALPGAVGWTAVTLAALGAGFLALAGRGGTLRFFLWLIAFFALGCVRGGTWAGQVEPPPSGWQVIAGQARSGWQQFPDRRYLELDVISLRRPGEAARQSRARLRLSVQTDPDRPGGCPLVLPGDRVLALASVRTPATTHNPGVPDRVRVLRRQGIEWTGTVEGCANLLVRPESGASIRRLAQHARHGVERFVHGREGTAGAKGILTALTVGERGRIPPQIREDFQRAGLAHLLAISGLHLGFVAAGCYLLLVVVLSRIAWLAIRIDVRRLSAGVVLPVTIFYTLLAGAHLPAVRACIMVTCFLVAVIARRRTDALQVLATAAVIILGIWPASLFEVSFLLSFAAVAGIILAVPVLAKWIRVPLAPDAGKPRIVRFGVRCLHFLLVSLAATLATAPLVAVFFNQASPAGLLANFLAVPLAAWVIVPLGLLVTIALPFSQVLAGWIADLALRLCDGLAALAGWFAGLPWSSWHVGTPSLIEVGCAYLVLASLLAWKRRRWVPWVALTCGVVLLASWSVRRLSPLLSNRLEVTFIDVGQGDSILVRLPGGRTLLVDGGVARRGGFDAGRRVVAPFLWSQGITRLDAIAVSHPQADHAGGLPGLVRLFRPAEVWAAEPLGPSPVTQDLARAAREVGARIRILRAGDRPWPAEETQVQVLWPPDWLPDLQENERSLVLRVSLGERAVLLTGDLEKRGEEGVLSAGSDVRADVLKVGHHGGRGATREAILRRIRPGVAVISVGAENPHGLPHAEVLERLDEGGIRVLRTDRHGAVFVTTDGADLTVQTWRDSS